MNGATPLQRFIAGPSVMRDCPDSAALRRHFRIEVKRTQRRSDGTVSLDGIRFEIPQVFGHLRELRLRYARWDRSCADIVDPRSGDVQAIYPLDKTRHADGRRRPIPQPMGVSSLPVTALKGERKSARQGDGRAPMMRHWQAQFAATGVPPAYLELDETCHDPEHKA